MQKMLSTDGLARFVMEKYPHGCHLYWLALGLDDRVLQSSGFLESCIFGFLDLRSLYFLIFRFAFQLCSNEPQKHCSKPQKLIESAKTLLETSKSTSKPRKQCSKPQYLFLVDIYIYICLYILFLFAFNSCIIY